MMHLFKITTSLKNFSTIDFGVFAIHILTELGIISLMKCRLFAMPAFRLCFCDGELNK